MGLAILGVKLGQACARLTHASVKFSSSGVATFFNSAICVLWSGLSPPPQTEQRMGRIVRGSDCHSQLLDPLLRGRTERFGGGRTVQPLWGWIVNVCGANHYSVG